MNKLLSSAILLPMALLTAGQAAEGLLTAVRTSEAATATAVTADASSRFDAYMNFEGSYLLGLSDGDMVPSTYIDGNLGPRGKEFRDTLSIIPLQGKDKLKSIELPVGNSVSVWPNNLAFTPDQKYVFVTEAEGQAPEGATRRSELPAGEHIRVIDLSDPKKPRVVQEVRIGGTPSGVSVHPDGELVAVTLAGTGRIALFPFTGGRLGEPRLLPAGPDALADEAIREFRWHPSGDFAVVTLPNANRVLFYKLEGPADAPELALWGDPLVTPPFPGIARWTPDGRHVIVAAIGTTPDMAESAYAVNTTLFLVYRFDATDAPDSPRSRADGGNGDAVSPPVRHVRVAQIPAASGFMENFAISPDGRWIVGLNSGAAGFIENYDYLPYPELTLFRFDPDSGIPTSAGAFPFDGALPQGIVFDASGQFLAATSFRHGNPERKGGLIHFWKLVDGPVPQLVQLDKRLDAPRGIHELELMP